MALPKGPYRVKPYAGGKGFSIRAGGREIAKINASNNTTHVQKVELAHVISTVDELLAWTARFEATLVYYIKWDELHGDDEGANLKSFMLAQVRETLARSKAPVAEPAGG